MDYKILHNDYGESYILKFKDETYAIVNTEMNILEKGDLGFLMKFGMWNENIKEDDVPQEERNKIAEIVKANCK